MTSLATDHRGNTLPAFRWGAKPHVLPVGPKAVASDYFKETTQVVCLLSTADFRFAIEANPVANESANWLPANTIVPVRVMGRERISVIQRTPDDFGEIQITEME